ncbi:MAG TPA: YCF48-related protein, partial [Pyrinomonadaceae bacterium]
MPAARRLLSSVFFLLLTAHCSLLTASGSPPAAHYWEKQKSGTLAWLRAVFFVDGERGWAVGAKGALLSTADGGASWQPRRAPTEDALRDIFFTDERTGWIVCERSVYLPRAKDEPRAYLLKTEDGGEKWARVEVTGIDLEAVLARVAFADAEHGWAAGEFGALYATADGGRTWARQRVPTRHLLLGAHFHDAETGWLVGAGTTLLHTSDGGATWRAGRIETAKKTATRARTVSPPSATHSAPPPR